MNSTALSDLRLVESKDAETQLGRNRVYGGLTTSYTQIFDFVEGQCPEPLRCSRVKCILNPKCHCISVGGFGVSGESAFWTLCCGVQVGDGKEKHFSTFCWGKLRPFPNCTDVKLHTLISTKRNVFSCLINFDFVGISLKKIVYFLQHVTKCSSRKIRKYKQMEKQVSYPHQ